MSKVYTKKRNKNISITDRRQRLIKNSLFYSILPTLKTPDVNKQNQWRRKP